MDIHDNLNQFADAEAYHAPSNFEIDGPFTCNLCGEQIRNGEMIVEQAENEYMHLKCVEWHIEDMQEGL